MNEARTLDQLWQERPRRPFTKWSLVAMLGLIGIVFTTSGFELGMDAHRWQNLNRFAESLIPYPLQGGSFEFGVAIDWAAGMWRDGAMAAAWKTFAISIVAVVLAMCLALLLTLPAARNFATPEPFLPGPRPPSLARRAAWRTLVGASRATLIMLRAIPEYIWAFLFVAMLGANAWPAILALALHNAGILGRLTSEVVENVATQSPAALRALGASRRQITVFSLLPQNFTRLLLYFFYRWETCIREATVLGMLGIASLGFLIDDARVEMKYDEMFFLILVSGAIVVFVDLLSILARHIARNS